LPQTVSATYVRDHDERSLSTRRGVIAALATVVQDLLSLAAYFAIAVVLLP
jgi:hypothetical protein